MRPGHKLDLRCDDPADTGGWFTRIAIAELVVEALEGLDLAFPKATKAHLEELAEARKRLGG